MNHRLLVESAGLTALFFLGTGCTIRAAGSSSDAGSAGNGADGGQSSVTDDGNADGGSGGDDGGTGDLDADPDATWNDNGCSTTAAGQVLFGFDDGYSGWFDDPSSSPHGAVGGTLADGVTCPGALTYTVPFTGYDQKSLVDFNWAYGSPSAWYGTKLHFSVKILLPGGSGASSGYEALLLIQPMMLWSDWNEGDFDMFEYVNPTLADGQWHQVVIPLLQDGGSFLGSVDGFRLQVQTQASAADAGGASPATAEFLFDDIWVE